MKRIFLWLLMAVLLFSIQPAVGYAAENRIETICFDDGSYVVVEIFDNGARASGSKTGKKQYTYYDGDNVSQWKVVLSGTFTYTGSSSSCTSSSVDTTIYDSAWYVVSKSASKSGNEATASVKMGDRPDGTTVRIVPVDLSLECDENGNLS